MRSLHISGSSTDTLRANVPSNLSAQEPLGVIALIHQMTQKQGFGEQELYNANHSVLISMQPLINLNTTALR